MDIYRTTYVIQSSKIMDSKKIALFPSTRVGKTPWEILPTRVDVLLIRNLGLRSIVGRFICRRICYQHRSTISSKALRISPSG